MNHLTDDQLVDLFYGDALAADREHAESCRECRARHLALNEALAAWREYPIPGRAEDYGRQVWSRLAPQLVNARPKRARRWLLAPVAAALLALAFYAGIWTDRKRVDPAANENAKSRERVLLMAMSDHLERSQIVLAELLDADAGSGHAADEEMRARNLLEENRLLRATAINLGDTSHAALLDDLERVLLALAHGEADGSPQDLRSLQQRVEQQGLLSKVRTTSSNARQRGRTL